MSPSALPWRGPGPGRPQLALPPDRMPLRHAGVWRKRWRYVAVFAEQMMICAARVQVGPLGQTFWAIWDRRRGRLIERTRPRLAGRRGEVWIEGADDLGARDDDEEGPPVRIGARHREAGPVEVALRFGAGSWAEAVCPAGEGGYVWTRKRAGVPVEAEVRVGGERLSFEGGGVEDESAGYHPRHTVWSWAAGVGAAADGRAVGWNLVAGVNDPPERSERAVWVDGEPFEPGPVSFEGLDAVRFDDGSRLEFAPEAERRRSENLLVVAYSYRQPFGRFSGTLPGGLELDHGLGVMEHHDARW